MGRKLIDITTAGKNEVVPAVAGQSIRVLSVLFLVGAAETVQVRSGETDDDTHNLTGPMPFGTNGGVCDAYNPEGVWETLPGEALNFYLTTGEDVGGSLTYRYVGPNL